MPASYDEFRAYWNARLESDELFLTEQARYVGYVTAFEIPMPRLLRLVKPAHDLIVLASLPARVRALYGLDYSRRQAVTVKLLTALARGARRVLPGRIVRGRNTRFFDAVASTERWRVQHGQWTPQVPETDRGQLIGWRRGVRVG